MRDNRQTMVYANLVYTRSLAPDVGGGQYAYGAALALILIVIGLISAFFTWRFVNMDKMLEEPKLEVQ